MRAREPRARARGAAAVPDAVHVVVVRLGVHLQTGGPSDNRQRVALQAALRAVLQPQPVPAAQADGFLHHAAQTDHAGLRAVVSRYSDLRTRCAKRTARRGREASVRRSTSLDVARKNRSARSYGRPADAVKTDGVRRISRWSFHRREDFFSASSVPRGSRGDGGAGAAPALARSARRATDARVLQTPPAHRRAAARAMMRARAHRVPRARRPKKTAGPTNMRAKRRGDGRGTVGFPEGSSSPCRTGRCPPSASGTWKAYLRVLG